MTVESLDWQKFMLLSVVLERGGVFDLKMPPLILEESEVE